MNKGLKIIITILLGIGISLILKLAFMFIIGLYTGDDELMYMAGLPIIVGCCVYVILIEFFYSIYKLWGNKKR